MKRKKNKSLPYVIATLFLCFFMFYFVVQDKKSTELHVFLESYAPFGYILKTPLLDIDDLDDLFLCEYTMDRNKVWDNKL